MIEAFLFVLVCGEKRMMKGLIGVLINRADQIILRNKRKKLSKGRNIS